MKDLSNLSNYPIYPRSLLYSTMPIWNDLTHTAMNDEALIYSDDLSKIILKELDK